MKKINFYKSLFFCFGIAGMFMLVFPILNAKEKPNKRVITSFSKYEVGAFPKSMRTFPFQRGKAKRVYKVAEEGGDRFLRAFDDQDLSVRVMQQFYWDIKEYPWVSWKWRARTLPAGADERDFKNRNDSACGIYVVFGKYSGKALKYVWSTSVPEGHIVRKNPNKFHIIVKKMGPAGDPNAWHRVSVNVPDSYKANFGEDLKKNPTGFGILTDGNAVHLTSACDYDHFVISKDDPLQ